MGEPTKYPNGALVSSTTTEIGIALNGDFYEGPVLVAITLVSGSLQVTVAPKSDTFTPAINAGGFTHTTWSTAGDRILKTVDTVNSEIRIKGTATFDLSW